MMEQLLPKNAINVRKGHSRIQQVLPVVPLVQRGLFKQNQVKQNVKHAEQVGIVVTHHQIHVMEVLRPVHQGHLTNYLGAQIQVHVLNVQVVSYIKICRKVWLASLLYSLGYILPPKVHMQIRKKVLHSVMSALIALTV